MKIRNYISEEQLERIISIIQEACSIASQKENDIRCRLSTELYVKLKKGRKAHDVTGDVYCSFFYEVNQINGIDCEVVQSGIYSQPELSNEDVVIHIYHATNKLQSNLVNERKKGERAFFAIKFETKNTYDLKTITVVDVKTGEKEIVYPHCQSNTLKLIDWESNEIQI